MPLGKERTRRPWSTSREETGLSDLEPARSDRCRQSALPNGAKTELAAGRYQLPRPVRTPALCAFGSCSSAAASITSWRQLGPYTACTGMADSIATDRGHADRRD